MNQQIETIKLNSIEDWPAHYLPDQFIIESENLELAKFLRKHDYHMIDRTIRATIPLKKSSDFSLFCRIPLEQMEKTTESIYKIAEAAFLLDSRFYRCASASKAEICQSIRLFVSGMKSFSICSCKGSIAGFLEIAEDHEHPEKQAFIRLAAVDEAYRTAGAALSLYAGAAELCRKRELKRLWGRISSRNTAVMNIYAALGASFSQPWDVYVKE